VCINGIPALLGTKLDNGFPAAFEAFLEKFRQHPLKRHAVEVVE
jgi:hypothetical protein